ncbi:MAG: hypothetical protein MJZ35_03785 [Bacteroidaceae bacterium]|nr:hypothetical protein [Bacteroidaceae bacterium]
MKKEYIQPVTKTIEVDDNILIAQSPDPNFLELEFDPFNLENIENEGFAD